MSLAHAHVDGVVQGFKVISPRTMLDPGNEPPLCKREA
jgi:hypothetical protein